MQLPSFLRRTNRAPVSVTMRRRRSPPPREESITTSGYSVETGPWHQRLVQSLRTKVQEWYYSYRHSKFSAKTLSSFPSNVSLYNEGDGLPCSHSHREKDCIVYVFKGLGRGLAVGFFLKSLFALALQLFRPRNLRNPSSLFRKVFLESGAFQFAKFLGVMSFAYRNLQCLFCKIRGKPGKRNSALAAFLAGTAILLDNGPGALERRATISLYLFVRGLYELARTLVAFKLVQPRQHLTKILFAVCQVPIMFNFLCYPSNLDPSYHKWILGMAKLSAAQAHGIACPTVRFRPCDQSLPQYHAGPCWKYNLKDFFSGLIYRAVPIYLPVHLLPGLIFKQKLVWQNPIGFLVDSAVGVARSSAFLASYTSLVKSWVCFWRWAVHGNSPLIFATSGLTTYFALLFEHPRRHIELLMYVAPRAIQSAVNMVGDDLPNWIQWLRETGLGDVLLFSSSMAMLVYAADTPPKLRGINATIFRLVFGSGTRMVSSDSIRSRQTTPLPSPPPEWEDDDDWDDGFGPSSPGPTSPDDSRSRFALEPVTETEREQ